MGAAHRDSMHRGVGMSVALTERQERDIEAFCQIARENGAAISLRELIELVAIEASEHELASAFDSDSKLGAKYLLESGYVLERLGAGGTTIQRAEEEDRRRALARANLARATAFGAALGRGAVVVCVSGANSFLSATEDEDIDFFCVTRTSGMWRFMVKALMLARIYKMARRGVPVLCFSCVMDEAWAWRKFKERQDPLFGRDALTAKVIAGSETYGSLLRCASWIGDYFPTLYELKLRETGSERDGRGKSSESGSAVLNAFLYLTAGSFLRIKSWATNRRLGKSMRSSDVFSTRMGPGHYIYESNRYKKLRTMYEEIEKGA